MTIIDLTRNTLLTDALTLPGRKKNVPELYEKDVSKYAGPHRWQIQGWAKLVRRAWRYRTYTRWVEQACEHISVIGANYLADIQGPCVFVANHQSHLDTLVVHHVLPEAIRSKLFYGAAQDRWFVKGQKKLALKPWYQSLALGTFPIMRGGGANALEHAHWLLKHKQHVFLFPEGTRGTQEELGEFKHGATLLALEHNVPIVPVYLGGLKELRPKGSKEVKRGHVSVEILPPVTFSPGSDVVVATEAIRRRLNRVHAKYVQSSVFRKAA
jgi:1-acyl-sn-glycerol-3-phosphate acyltransferase